TGVPSGGKSRTTFEVSLSGLDLDDATQLHFSHSNIVSRPKLDETSRLPEANKLIVTIASNLPPGIYEARVVGPFGVSNARAFVSGQLPETIESQTNTTDAAAMELALNTVVNGHSRPNTINYFKF